MSQERHFTVPMTVEQVQKVRDSVPVEVYPEGAESRTVVLSGSGHGAAHGHYRFCFMQPKDLDDLLAGEEVVIVDYDDRYHLTVADLG